MIGRADLLVETARGERSCRRAACQRPPGVLVGGQPYCREHGAVRLAEAVFDAKVAALFHRFREHGWEIHEEVG